MKRDPLASTPLLPWIGRPGDVARLADLPRRQGRRPRIDPHPVPHRQLDQLGSDAMWRKLRELFDAKMRAGKDMVV